METRKPSKKTARNLKIEKSKKNKLKNYKWLKYFKGIAPLQAKSFLLLMANTFTKATAHLQVKEYTLGMVNTFFKETALLQVR